MRNTIEDKEYVDSCLRIYKQRIERDIGLAKDHISDFLHFLEQCGIDLRKKKENEDAST